MLKAKIFPLWEYSIHLPQTAAALMESVQVACGAREHVCNEGMIVRGREGGKRRREERRSGIQ